MDKDRAGFVYLMWSEKMQFYKIGYSKDPKERCNQLNTQYKLDWEIRVWLWTPYMETLERCFHKLFADKRIAPNREWFSLTRDDVVFFAYLAKGQGEFESLTKQQANCSCSQTHAPLQGVTRTYAQELEAEKQALSNEIQYHKDRFTDARRQLEQARRDGQALHTAIRRTGAEIKYLPGGEYIVIPKDSALQNGKPETCQRKGEAPVIGEDPIPQPRGKYTQLAKRIEDERSDLFVSQEEWDEESVTY